MSVGVGEAERSARAEVAVGAGVRAERAFVHRELEAEAEARDAAQHGVFAVDLFAHRLLYGGGLEDAHTVEFGGGGQRAVEPRERPRVAVAVGGGHLGAAPRLAVGLDVDLRVRRGVLGLGALLVGRARGHGHEVRDAGVVLPRQADVEVDAGGLPDLLAQEGTEAAAVDASHEFADEEALGVGVVAVAGAGLPERFAGGERRADGVPVDDRARRQLGGEARQPGLVGEQVAHGKLRLAGLREFGPVARDGGVEVDRAALDKPQGADRGDRLADGVEVGDGVALPRAGARRVGVAAPEVDDDAAVDGDGERRTDLAGLGEDAGEGFTDGVEAGGGLAVDFDRLAGHSSLRAQSVAYRAAARGTGWRVSAR